MAVDGMWTLRDDGEWELQEPYKSMLVEAKVYATKGWHDNLIEYLAKHTGYGREFLHSELMRRNDKGMTAVEMTDQFVLEALGGDLQSGGAPGGGEVSYLVLHGWTGGEEPDDMLFPVLAEARAAYDAIDPRAEWKRAWKAAKGDKKERKRLKRRSYVKALSRAVTNDSGEVIEYGDDIALDSYGYEEHELEKEGA